MIDVAPSPRSSRGEGWGEELCRQARTRGESPSPEAFGFDLSPPAGRGDRTPADADSIKSPDVLARRLVGPDGSPPASPCRFVKGQSARSAAVADLLSACVCAGSFRDSNRL